MSLSGSDSSSSSLTSSSCSFDAETHDAKRAQVVSAAKSGAGASDAVPDFVARWLESSPLNNMCADCGSPSPRWASINHGVSVCIECSGVHRHLGVHVSKPRSLLLDEWPEGMWAEFVAGGGNAAVNAVLEAAPPAGYVKPTATASRAQRDLWIAKKYAERAFVAGNTTAPLSAEQIAQLGASDAAAASVRAASATAMTEYKGMIAVTLLEGKDLMAKDVNGKSDPYVVLRLGAQEVKSKTKKKTLNPVWNETLMLCVPDFGATLEISAFDWDKVSSDDSLGTASVTVVREMESESGVHLWVPLEGATSGALHLKLVYNSLVH